MWIKKRAVDRRWVVALLHKKKFQICQDGQRHASASVAVPQAKIYSAWSSIVRENTDAFLS